MSRPADLHARRPSPERPARFGRTILIEWIQPREPYGGWSHYAFFEPEEVQTCLSTDHLIHDDSMKILAGPAMIVGDDVRVMLSGIIEIPARCVVRIARLEEVQTGA